MKRKSLLLIVGIVASLFVASVSLADGAPHQATLHGEGWFGVTLTAVTDNGDGTSTWSYRVEELMSGKGIKDLGYWILGIEECVVVLDADPHPYEVGPNPHTRMYGLKYGIKWEVNDRFESGIFSFTVEGTPPETTVPVGTKAGRYVDLAGIAGPGCSP